MPLAASHASSVDDGCRAIWTASWFIMKTGKRYDCDVDASTEAKRKFTGRTHFICLGCEQMTRVVLGGNSDCCWGVWQ